MRFVGALETVLDPIVALLDSLPAHFDPDLAPRRHPRPADRLAGRRPRRGPAARAAARRWCRAPPSSGRRRGTRAGLELALALNFPGLPLRVEDEGAVSWASDSAPAKDAPAPSFVVYCDTAGATGAPGRHRASHRGSSSRSTSRYRLRVKAPKDDASPAAHESLPQLRPRERGRRGLLRVLRRVPPLGATRRSCSAVTPAVEQAGAAAGAAGAGRGGPAAGAGGGRASARAARPARRPAAGRATAGPPQPPPPPAPAPRAAAQPAPPAPAPRAAGRRARDARAPLRRRPLRPPRSRRGPAAARRAVMLTCACPTARRARRASRCSRSIEPGGRASVLAVLRNQSRIVDNYELRVEGLPDDWWSIFPNTVYLVPFGTGGTYEQEVEVHPAPAALAGGGGQALEPPARRALHRPERGGPLGVRDDDDPALPPGGDRAASGAQGRTAEGEVRSHRRQQGQRADGREPRGARRRGAVQVRVRRARAGGRPGADHHDAARRAAPAADVDRAARRPALPGDRTAAGVRPARHPANGGVPPEAMAPVVAGSGRPGDRGGDPAAAATQGEGPRPGQGQGPARGSADADQEGPDPQPADHPAGDAARPARLHRRPGAQGGRHRQARLPGHDPGGAAGGGRRQGGSRPHRPDSRRRRPGAARGGDGAGRGDAPAPGPEGKDRGPAP